jgi:Cu/Ag efflux pump CusA
VIGGLIFATVSTLFFVPVMFSIFHRHRAPKPAPEAHFGAAHAPA